MVCSTVVFASRRCTYLVLYSYPHFGSWTTVHDIRGVVGPSNWRCAFSANYGVCTRRNVTRHVLALHTRLSLTHSKKEQKVHISAHGTPLHLASWEGRTENVRLLLDRGASVDANDKDERLRYYTSRHPWENIRIVRLLLAQGASADVKDK